jgi:membrane protein
MSILSFTIRELRDLNLKNFITRFYTKAFQEEDLMSAAAQVAFYFAFALFPLLLFIISLFGMVLETADDLRTEMFFYLRQVMPGSAYDLVQKTVEEVTENSSGGKLTFGFLVAIWSASAGVDSIRIALNGVYNLTEDRPWWKTKLTSVSLTLGLGILVTIALGVIFYGGKLLSLILSYINIPISSPFFLGVLQVVVILTVLVTVFALIYNFLPNHEDHKWTWVTPGAIIGIALWVVLSYAFKLYLGYFNTYDKTYGSLGAVIILMLWLYLTALVILTGGTINAVLQEFSDPETAEAGANKAAAKEIVENPDKSAAPGKKTETLVTLKQDSESDSNRKDDVKPELIDADNLDRGKPELKRSKLKLFAGLLIGFIENLKKR